MQQAMIYLDSASTLNLQNQIRQKLVDGILCGTFPPGTKLPSSRKLAKQLGVARNTVVLAYQALLAEGYLESRERSGVYVGKEMLDARVGFAGTAAEDGAQEASAWRRRIKTPPNPGRAAREVPNWNQYPYPFIDGRFDASLFPLAEWREAARLALSVADVRDWSSGSGDADDPMLIEEIRTKILTKRGMQAKPDEILITMGTQNSLFLISHLLLDKSVAAGIEEPGNAEMRRLFEERQSRIVPLPVDAQGILVDGRLADCDLVYVTPSHQIPTAVVMSLARRQALVEAAAQADFVVVEDDYECEINYLKHPEPALRSMDGADRVIYVASFSKVLAPGMRLGCIVANPEFIRRARELRRAMLNHPPLHNQRTTALFLSLGHYDALMLRLGRIFRQRRMTLRDALNCHRGVSVEISPEVGGTTYWVRLPDDFKADFLVSEARRQGILVESVSRYYARPENAQNCFRMGITSLPEGKIRPGVANLMKLVRALVSPRVEHLETSIGEWLTGDALRRALADKIIIYNVVYGVPCTIELHGDGRMLGRAGYANEDCDQGRWWVAGDRYHRQWRQWNYGEEAAYYVVVDEDRIKWFNEERQIVDSAFIHDMARSG